MTASKCDLELLNMKVTDVRVKYGRLLDKEVVEVGGAPPRNWFRWLRPVLLALHLTKEVNEYTELRRVLCRQCNAMLSDSRLDDLIAVDVATTSIWPTCWFCGRHVDVCKPWWRRRLLFRRSRVARTSSLSTKETTMRGRKIYTNVATDRV